MSEERSQTPVRDECPTSPISEVGCEENEQNRSASVLPSPATWRTDPIPVREQDSLSAQMNQMKIQITELQAALIAQTEVLNNVIRASHLESNVYVHTLLLKVEEIMKKNEECLKEIPKNENFITMFRAMCEALEK